MAPNNFTAQLKDKNRNRRETQSRLQAAMAAPNPRRNDLVPPLARVDVQIDALRFPSRKVRAFDEAHVQDVMRSIAGLGFCVADPYRQGQSRP